MNAFQILDREGNPISMGDLDREVCLLTGNEPDKKWYCRLGNEKDYPQTQKGHIEYIFGTTNWYDSIGWMIAFENKSFEDIIQHYTDLMQKFIGEIDEDGEIITIEKIYPYHMAVLVSWIEKGYKAKQIVQ